MGERIWTIDARDNAMLEVVSASLELSPEAMHGEIRSAHAETVRILAAKGVDYSRLRGALSPSRDKQEVAFVFDSAAAGEYDYGTPIGEAILPLLPRKAFSCAVLTGDLLLGDQYQDLGFNLLGRDLQLHKPVRSFRYTNELYAIYVNNLTAGRAETLHQGLKEFRPYIGRINCTYSSPTKDWLSSTLGTRYVKLDGIFIGQHEDDVPNDEDYNLPGWPLEEHEYRCVSIQSMYFDLFLSYKIERRIIPGETDTNYALNAISTSPGELTEFEIEMDDDKLAYIAAHGGGFRSAGMASKTREQVLALIRERIDRNYIYALELKPHPTGIASLFAIMLEFPRLGDEPVRVMAALEYLPATRILRVVTLF